MQIHETTVPTPVGDLWLAFHGEALCALAFADHREELARSLPSRFGDVSLAPLPRENDAVARLRAFFAGDLAAIDTIPVETGGTPFQRKVWEELRKIPPGRPISYAELARRVGSPRATRAVGAANGANPVAIVVPCHRVVATGGKLGGYGGGLSRKRWLLAHEERAALEPAPQGR